MRATHNPSTFILQGGPEESGLTLTSFEGDSSYNKLALERVQAICIEKSPACLQSHTAQEIEQLWAAAASGEETGLFAGVVENMKDPSSQRRWGVQHRTPERGLVERLCVLHHVEESLVESKGPIRGVLIEPGEEGRDVCAVHRGLQAAAAAYVSQQGWMLVLLEPQDRLGDERAKGGTGVHGC